MKMTFHKQLVLNRYMYRFFKGGSLQTVKERLGDDRHEGIDEDGQTLFFHELTRNLFNVDCISIEDLRRYDLNIVAHWQRITRRRNRLEETKLKMKYFQYLSLLFTEIYLDWYFNRQHELLAGLNDELAVYNAQNTEEHRFRPFDGDELNKLAFWNATGSGKTLLLHVNILQYLHYFQQRYKDNQKNGFKRNCYPVLYEIPPEFAGKIKPPHVDLDLYPRLEALSSQNKGSETTTANLRHKGKLPTAAMAMFDFDRIYLAVQDFKLQRSMTNLRLDRADLEGFCKTGNGWYTLYIPEAELAINRVADIRKLEDILIRLLQDYTERFYKALKNGYEGQYYEVVTVRHDDDTMLKVYHFAIEDTDDGQVYLERLEELKKLVASGAIGEVSAWKAGQMVAICFDRHLYYLLMSIQGDVPLKMRPLAFDAPSEIRFVQDLEAFYHSPKGQAAVAGRSLYLLRNADTKAKGLGFALAGNFYPDFLLWLVDDASGKQWLSLVDPKGIRQMGLNDPKFGLYKEVKVLQDKLADPKLVLNAFILSATDIVEWKARNEKTEQELEDMHLLFMGSEKQTAYLEKMFVRMDISG